MVTKRISREVVLSEARRLVKAGVSRRQMDRTLRAKFGTSVGHDTHIDLFGARVTEIAEREAARAVGFRRPRTRRQSRFNKLVSAHFLPEEARILATGLITLKYPEVSVMVGQRKALYGAFLRRAAEKGFSTGAFRREWRRTVNKWYKTTVTRWRRDLEAFQRAQSGKPVVRRRMIADLIWTWFGHAKKELPPDMQTETPRRQRRRRQRAPVTRRRITQSQKINSLEAQLKVETRPSVRAFLRELIKKEQTQ